MTTKNIKALKAMGIDDEVQIRNALKQADNNMDQAVQLLFPEDMEFKDTQTYSSDSDQDSTTASHSFEEERMREVDDPAEYHQTDESMGEGQPCPSRQSEELPPPYEDIVDQHKNLPSTEEESSIMEEEETPPPPPPSQAPSSTSSVSNIEFPLTHFYELEGRVHTEQWSIPYKKEESLGRCMLATIAMMKEG